MTFGIYALCITKDEGDIIGFSLQHAATFCTRIFVLDNGSSDNSWEIVKNISKKNPIIVPLEKKDCQFGDGLRGYVFNKIKNMLTEGDWVMILDSDEFSEDDPRPCIEYCERYNYDFIDAFIAQFYVTELDVHKEWFKKQSAYISSFHELPSYYKINWKVQRFFKYKYGLEWQDLDDDGIPTQIALPTGLNKKCPKMLLSRHYQYRSYHQMQQRLRIRSELYKKTGFFPHNKNDKVSEYIRKERGLKLAKPGTKITFSKLDALYVSLFKIKRSKKLKRWLPNKDASI